METKTNQNIERERRKVVRTSSRAEVIKNLEQMDYAKIHLKISGMGTKVRYSGGPFYARSIVESFFPEQPETEREHCPYKIKVRTVRRGKCFHNKIIMDRHDMIYATISYIGRKAMKGGNE